MNMAAAMAASLVVLIIVIGNVESRHTVHNVPFAKKTQLPELATVAEDVADDQQTQTRTCTPDSTLQQQCQAELTGYDTNPQWIANQDEQDLRWIKKCIADYYCFKQKEGADEWSEIPTLGDALGSDYMTKAAARVRQFFDRNDDWDTTKGDPRYRVVGGACTNLLYITAARYLYVTHVLYDVSGGSLTVCETENKKTKIPAAVCYPPNYGSQTCTSDYDVGLVGPESGSIAALFNEYFQDGDVGFGKASEEVFDTNIYAYTLEYAMPEIYSGLSQEFIDGVSRREQLPKYHMQEVASAIFKVYKYNQGYAKQLLQVAKDHLPASWAKQLSDWNALFLVWDRDVETLVKKHGALDFRAKHNKIYQMLVGGVTDAARETGLPPEHMAQVTLALLYAAEAYHTRGAIRHVVGATQMKNPAVIQSLNLWDFWSSMLENWGDSLKEHGHCGGNTPVEQCLVKLSKYMWRLFVSMREIRTRLPAEMKTSLKEIGAAEGPEKIMSHWLYDLKKAGIGSIPAQERINTSSPAKDYMKVFLDFFQCSADRRGQPLSDACMKKIQGVVGSFHTTLAILIKEGKLK